MSAREGILLVGGNGFLGSALAKALVKADREVHVLSRSTEPGRRHGINFHRGDQGDDATVAPLLRACGTVVHLASTTTPGSSARIPEMDTAENVKPCAVLIERLCDSPPERLIFVSSGGAVYGNPKALPVDESFLPNPLSYHAAGKVALEALFTVFAQANRVPLAIMRPSNIYGPGQCLRNGFGLVRTLLEKALQGRTVEMWGDGSAVRDYLFIDDAVAALLRLINDSKAIGPFNAGSGVGTSIKSLIEYVPEITGRPLEIMERPARKTDVHHIVLDSSKLRLATGWTPVVTLKEGLLQTWTWLKQGAP